MLGPDLHPVLEVVATICSHPSPPPICPLQPTRVCRAQRVPSPHLQTDTEGTACKSHSSYYSYFVSVCGVGAGKFKAINRRARDGSLSMDPDFPSRSLLCVKKLGNGRPQGLGEPGPETQWRGVCLPLFHFLSFAVCASSLPSSHSPLRGRGCFLAVPFLGVQNTESTESL